MTRRDFDRKMIISYTTLSDRLGGKYLNEDAFHDAYISMLNKVESVQEDTFYQQYKQEYNAIAHAYYAHTYNELEFDESFMSKPQTEDLTEEQKTWRQIELERFRRQAEQRMKYMPQLATDCLRLKAKGWSVRGIAEALGMTASAVGKLIERATQSLAAKIPPPFIYLIYNELWN